MLNLKNFQFRYEPYPIGCAPGVFDPGDYQALLAAYPKIELFKHKPVTGDKWSLSEVNNPREYKEFLSSSPIWGKFHGYIKSRRFLDDILGLIEANHIYLGLGKVVWRGDKALGSASVLSRIRRKTELSARFEFSMMGGHGGHLRPHTDHPNKMVTLVLSMVEPGEWNGDWGGGTTVCLPKDRSLIASRVDLGFDDVEVIHDFPFLPNQCVLFIKTYNSWHHVAPMTAPEPAPLRRTVTVNLERLV